MNSWFAGKVKDKVSLTLEVSKPFICKSVTYQHIHEEVHRSALSLPEFI